MMPEKNVVIRKIKKLMALAEDMVLCQEKGLIK